MIKNIIEVITLNKLKLYIMFILTLIVSIGSVYVVYARVDIVDSVIYNTGSLWTKVGVIICILIIVELLRAWLKIIIAQLVKQWKIYLGDRISKNIETMSQSEFNKVDSGEHMTKYTYQLELLSAYLFSPLTGLLSAIVLFISSVVFLSKIIANISVQFASCEYKDVMRNMIIAKCFISHFTYHIVLKDNDKKGSFVSFQRED